MDSENDAITHGVASASRERKHNLEVDGNGRDGTPTWVRSPYHHRLRTNRSRWMTAKAASTRTRNR